MDLLFRLLGANRRVLVVGVELEVLNEVLNEVIFPWFAHFILHFGEPLVKLVILVIAALENFTFNDAAEVLGRAVEQQLVLVGNLADDLVVSFV